MSRTITIEPLTRIEGHARIRIDLDEEGRPADASFEVTQVRGFESLCEGRPVEELPALMARICGICPVSHLLASAQAVEQIFGLEVPPAGRRLRTILNLGQIVQSHALSFFYLSLPDLLLGMDAPAKVRNISGLLAENEALVREGVRLRSFGQRLVEAVGGARIHPDGVVPGGVTGPPPAAGIEALVSELPKRLAAARFALETLIEASSSLQDEIESFAAFPSMYMALRGSNGFEFDGGPLALLNHAGGLAAEVPKERWRELVTEANNPRSYLKRTYYPPLGPDAGMYRVGPIARLHMSGRAGTPIADAAASELWRRAPRLESSFHYHECRLIEVLFALERLCELLIHPDLFDPQTRSFGRPSRREGIGIVEAPRGTLIHHYTVDAHGLVERADLVVATGHNALAMGRGVREVARRFLTGPEPTEGELNRVEAVIRCFDPCLSCSTHAVGQMPLEIRVHDHGGSLVHRWVR